MAVCDDYVGLQRLNQRTATQIGFRHPSVCTLRPRLTRSALPHFSLRRYRTLSACVTPTAARKRQSSRRTGRIAPPPPHSPRVDPLRPVQPRRDVRGDPRVRQAHRVLHLRARLEHLVRRQPRLAALGVGVVQRDPALPLVALRARGGVHAAAPADDVCQGVLRAVAGRPQAVGHQALVLHVGAVGCGAHLADEVLVGAVLIGWRRDR